MCLCFILLIKGSVCKSRSVVSDSLWSHKLYSPWNSPGQNTGVAFPFSRGSSQPRDQAQVIHITDGFFYQLSHKGSPRIPDWVASALLHMASLSVPHNTMSSFPQSKHSKGPRWKPWPSLGLAHCQFCHVIHPTDMDLIWEQYLNIQGLNTWRQGLLKVMLMPATTLFPHNLRQHMLHSFPNLLSPLSAECYHRSFREFEHPKPSYYP